jgi:hypothetical protein
VRRLTGGPCLARCACFLFGYYYCIRVEVRFFAKVNDMTLFSLCVSLFCCSVSVCACRSLGFFVGKGDGYGLHRYLLDDQLAYGLHSIAACMYIRRAMTMIMIMKTIPFTRSCH